MAIKSDSKYVVLLGEMHRPLQEIQDYNEKSSNRPMSFFRYRPANVKNIAFRKNEINGEIFLRTHNDMNDLLDLTIFDKPLTDIDTFGNEIIESLGDVYFDSLSSQLTLSEIERIKKSENKMQTIKTMLL
jgi:hypothetical protein